jgi:hypothetical protein
MKTLHAWLLLFCLLLAAGVRAETVTLAVHAHSVGDGPADLASGGIPCGPGVLFNETDVKLMDGTAEVAAAVQTLARWHGDGSIRAFLLQFEADFAGDTKNFTLHIGQIRSLDRSLIPVTWDFPAKIITLPADYLCASLALWEQTPLGSTDFTAWEQKQVNDYGRIDYDGATLNNCPGIDQYYNSIHSSYQLYARSGDLEYLLNGRKWALHHAGDQIYLSGDRIGRAKCSLWDGGTRYTYVQGLVDDYFLWGGQESLDVAGIIVDNFFMAHSDTFYYLAPGERWQHWNERDPAFALLGLVAYYEAVNDISYLNEAKRRIDLLHQMQADNGGTAWIHNLHDHDPDYSECDDTNSWGVSPWMTGLLLEGIIKYHKLTGYETARQSIIWALDYLMNNCLATGANAGESFTYLCGCSNPVYQDGLPDLDNMISYAFAYGYKITADTDYKDVATSIFNTAVSKAYTGSAKHYNQQFRTSGHTVLILTALVPTYLQGYSAAYTGASIEINWSISEAGAGMRFAVLRYRAGQAGFIELSDARIIDHGMSFTFVDDDIEPGETYTYRVLVYDEKGEWVLFETGAVTTSIPALTLDQNYPNPFNPRTTITYTIPGEQHVTLTIHDAAGRRVRTLVDAPRHGGIHREEWNGRTDEGIAAAAGVYFIRLRAGGAVRTRQLVMLK